MAIWQARGKGAVVAALAVRRDPGVVHDCASKRDRVPMACIALCLRRDVACTRRLACSDRAVVAGGAASSCVGRVSECSARECRRGLVAGLADIVRCDMRHRFLGNTCICPAVAGLAARGNPGVVHDGASKRDRVPVACIALRLRWDVACTRRFADRLGAVVAAGALSSCVGGVNECSACERRCACVARLARGRRLDVTRAFALGGRAIVAGRATRRDSGVVERGAREGRRVCVARLARGRRLDVTRAFADRKSTRLNSSHQ